MSIFGIILLVQFWLTALAGSCDIDTANNNYYTCLYKWKLIRNHHQIGHAGFMRKPEYMDEICILPNGVNVEAMNDCITKNVSPFCDGTMITWEGLKNFVNFLCRRREMFVANWCRRNPYFQDAYSACMTEGSSEVSSREEDCRSFRNLKQCLHKALNEYCSPEDRAFFEKAFELRDRPQTSFACKDLQTNANEPNVKQNGERHHSGSTHAKLTSNTANEQTTVDKSNMRSMDERQTEKVVLVMIDELPSNTANGWRSNTYIWLTSTLISALFVLLHRQ